MKHKILLIDNFDSFVHLLADELLKRNCDVNIHRASMPLKQALKEISKTKPDALVFSPGPGAPQEASLCLGLLGLAPKNLPILGICLGLQCMVHYYGGIVTKSPEIKHGKMSMLNHNATGIFTDAPNPMPVARYHSLAATKISPPLTITATSENIVMAVSHQTLPRSGLQFHPESILTPFGGLLIENFISTLRRKSC